MIFVSVPPLVFSTGFVFWIVAFGGGSYPCVVFLAFSMFVLCRTGGLSALHLVLQSYAVNLLWSGFDGELLVCSGVAPIASGVVVIVVVFDMDGVRDMLLFTV